MAETPAPPPGPILAWRPVTPANWDDLSLLFGPKGACAGCWCMYWRTATRREWQAGKGDGNRQAMQALVDGGTIPGILAYADDEAIGWCSVALRNDFPGLARARVLRRLDDRKVWSISCLFIRKDWRRSGVATFLLSAAASFVREQGGEWLEGYPVIPTADRVPDAFAWTGTLSAFQRAGFVEAGRHSPARPIMRLHLKEDLA